MAIGLLLVFSQVLLHLLISFWNVSKDVKSHIRSLSQGLFSWNCAFLRNLLSSIVMPCFLTGTVLSHCNFVLSSRGEENPKLLKN